VRVDPQAPGVVVTVGIEPSDAELFQELKRSRRRQVRNTLVDRHIGFARHIAKRYRNRGIADDDLNQIALLALVKAVDRYDPDFGSAFTAFAGRTIEGEIKRHFRDAAWSVRVPRSTKELHLMVRQAREDLHHELGRSPTVKDVAARLEISTDDVVEAMGAAAVYSSGSLDSLGSTDGTGSPDRSRHLAAIDERLEAAPNRVLVDQLIASLPEREQEIVRLRFYRELSQTEIAERVGVSQMHVSRLLRRSFNLMRRAAEQTVANPKS
jgi:RNA polymerase sigma-B factor